MVSYKKMCMLPHIDIDAIARGLVPIRKLNALEDIKELIMRKMKMFV